MSGTTFSNRVVTVEEHERVILARLLGVEGAVDGPAGDDPNTELFRLPSDGRVLDVDAGIVLEPKVKRKA